MLLSKILASASASAPSYLAPTAVLVVAAAAIGYLSSRAKVVPIVGFLVAGVLIGPDQLGIVDNGEAVEAAAEIGVILLLFTIGIEFSLERLARVRSWIALAGGLQVLLATGAGVGLTLLLGGPWRDGIFTGFLLALSSTAIVLKLLGERETSSLRGRLAVAVLVAQDLAVVVMVLLVPLLGSHHDEGGSAVASLGRAILTALCVIAVVLLLARRVMPTVLDMVARICSPEIFLLTVIAVCFGTAYVTALAGVSVSLGAFLAGLVVSESRASTQALAEVLPLQIVFSAAFFVSVGMLLDLGFLAAHLPLVLGAAAAVLVVKALTTSVAALAVRVPWQTAVATGLLLAQIGEFSFVLLTVGSDAGLSPFGLGDGGPQMVIATTVLLMIISPLLAASSARAARLGTSHRARTPQASTDQQDRARPEHGDAHGAQLAGHVVIIGWGPAALTVAATLRERNVPVVMTTLNPDGAARAELAGHHVLRGDSTKAEVLRQAGLPTARLVVIAEDGPEQSARAVAAARPLTAASIITRPLGDADVAGLAAAGADHVIDRDQLSGEALVDSVLAQLGHRTMEGDQRRTAVDTSRVVRYPWPPTKECSHGSAVRPVLPQARGCVGCLRAGTEWVHLRLCLICGYVGCCDSSPQRHARAHAHDVDHPLITSCEPGESWGYCFPDALVVSAPVQAPAEPVLQEAPAALR